MKLLVAILTAGWLFLILAGCSPPISSGVVVEKNHTPERTWTEIAPHMVGKIRIYSIAQRRSPESWSLTIQARVKDKLRLKTVSVPEEIYNEVLVGEVYPRLEQQQ